MSQGLEKKTTSLIISHPKTLKNIRIPLTVNNNQFKTNVSELVTNNLIIHYEGYKAFFIRLRYKGCPTIRLINDGNYAHQLINMDRDSFILKIYNILQDNSINGSLRIRFRGIVNYISWLDNNNITPKNAVYFAENYIDKYMEYLSTQHALGKIATNSWRNYKSAISFFLKKSNRSEQARRLKTIPLGTSNHYKPYSIEELKEISRILFKAFRVFKQHFETNTSPTTHPFFDLTALESQRDKLGWNSRKFATVIKGYKTCFSQTDWKQQFIRVAIMITFLFTGKNTSSLLKMKIGDVAFKSINNGRYILYSEKPRANYQQQDNTIGFSKHAKRFIEAWLSISTTISKKGTDGPLFPYITSSNEVSDWIKSERSPQDRLNKMITKLGLPPINASRFRVTKIDILMRVTEDLLLISQSANNSINVIRSNYSDGVDSDHERALSASVNAKFNIVKEEEIEDSIKQAKYDFADILSDYEYKKYRSTNSDEALTPQGLRCQNKKKGSAERIFKILQKSGAEVPSDEIVCTDYLGCFECGNYKLVAGIDDIWLMLSFYETIEELNLCPSINSLPATRFIKVKNTISAILQKLKSVSPKNYERAQTKLGLSSHPLYSDIHSLNDLLEVFS